MNSHRRSMARLGTAAGLIGAIGAFVLAAGTVLFLTARRRRVVLVTPGDGERTD